MLIFSILKSHSVIPDHDPLMFIPRGKWKYNLGLFQQNFKWSDQAFKGPFCDPIMFLWHSFTHKTSLGEGKKKLLLRANGFQKAVGRSGIYIYIFFNIFCQNYLKNHDFFLARFAWTFSFKFLSKKWLILQYLGVKQKKLCKWGKSGRSGP